MNNIIKFKDKSKLSAIDLAKDVIEQDKSGSKGKATDLVTITGWEDGTITIGSSDMTTSDFAYYIKAAEIQLQRDMTSGD